MRRKKPRPKKCPNWTCIGSVCKLQTRQTKKFADQIDVIEDAKHDVAASFNQQITSLKFKEARSYRETKGNRTRKQTDTHITLLSK